MVSYLVHAKILEWCHYLLLAVSVQFQQEVLFHFKNKNNTQNTARKTYTVSARLLPTLHTLSTCERFMSSSVLVTNVFDLVNCFCQHSFQLVPTGSFQMNLLSSGTTITQTGPREAGKVYGQEAGIVDSMRVVPG
jgi:hypothetical protein